MNPIRILAVARTLVVTGFLSLFLHTAYAEQPSASNGWGISPREWINEPRATLQSRIDLLETRQLLETAAQAGDAKAQVLAATAYRYGIWGEKDPAKALDLIRAAAKRGDVRGIAVLGEMYLSDPSKHDEAVKLLMDAFDRKSGLAAAVLGFMYEYARGVPADPVQAVSWYQKSADAGSSLGMRFLAFALVNGVGTKANVAEGAAWATRAAALGDNEAMRLLGVIAENGMAGAKDDRQAVEWYRKAADAGSTEASRELASRHESGRGVDRDLGKAVDLYERAANAGDIKAAARLGILYGSEKLGKPNYALAEKWLKPAAAQGDTESAYLLAVLYASDESGMKDQAKAAPLWKQAAEAGDKRAMRYWGVSLINGEGTPKNETEGAEWIRKAAEAGDEEAVRIAKILRQRETARLTDPAAKAAAYRLGAESGDPESMRDLAFALVNGNGVSKNEAEGAKWALKAANAGDNEAMRLMGVLAHTGRGVPQNETESTEWFRKAAEAGNTSAMVAYAERLGAGSGMTSNDPAQALLWFQKAAGKGDQVAMEKYADALQEGIGTNKNPEEAAKWYEKLMALGNVNGQIGLAYHYWNKPDLEKAETNFVEAAKKVKNDSPKLGAILLQKAAIINLSKKSWKHAQELLAESDALAESIGELKLVAENTEALAKEATKGSRFDYPFGDVHFPALAKKMERAIEIRRNESGGHDSKKKLAGALLLYAEVAGDDDAEAIEHALAEARSIAASINDQDLADTAIYSRWNVLRSHPSTLRSPKVVEAGWDVISSAKRTGNRQALMHVSYLLGFLFEKSDDKKIRLLRLCLDAAKELNDAEHKKSCSTKLADLLDENESFYEAKEVAELAESVAKQTSDSKALGDAYLAKGRAYEGLGKYREADNLYIQSRQIYENINDKSRIYWSLYYRMGLYAIKYENYKIACDLGRQAKAIRQQVEPNDMEHIRSLVNDICN